MVLLVYAAAGVVISVPLMLLIGPAARVDNGTSVQLLGVCVLSLAIGAVLAARDPEGNKGLLVVEIVFSALASLVFVAYVVVHHGEYGFERTRYALVPLALVGLVLLLVTFPYGSRRDTEAD